MKNINQKIWYKPFALPDQRSQGPVLNQPENTDLTKHNNKTKRTTITGCKL